MPNHYPDKAVCPECGWVHDFTVYPVVNAETDPELKKKLLNGELFTTTCPECQNTFRVIFDCLYHDPAKKIMIQFCLPEKTETYRKIFDDLCQDSTKFKGYTFRIVTGYYDLVEKIQIRDNGLDDRVMELCKRFTAGNLSSKVGYDIYDIKFFVRDDGIRNLALFSEDGPQNVLELHDELYEMMSDMLEQLDLEDLDQYIVDAEWSNKAAEIIKKADSRPSEGFVS
ncbi:MAG: CpXC domain-containing protein [Erysipelotrichaceae bacterium]|nr:CpXC domain-containing protein [Erysipelotrichaceae bacterium]